MAGLRPRRRNREEEERGSKQRLTGRSMGWSACSGKAGVEQGGEDDLGRPRLKTRTVAAMEADRKSVV